LLLPEKHKCINQFVSIFHVKTELMEVTMIGVKYFGHLLFCAVLISLLSLAGCNEGNMDKMKSAFTGVKKLTATPEVERAMNALRALEKNPDQVRILDAAHQDWIRLRKTHCAALATPGDSATSQQKINECYATFDQQRIEMLNQQRISRLFDIPSPAASPDRAINIAYSPETTARPSIPRSLAVASSAPITAVTFNDTTEIIDLVSGQILSKIQTLDEEKRRGMYHHYLTPNGRILIVSYHWPKTGLKMWDATNGDLLRDKMISSNYLRFPMSDFRSFVYTDRNRMGIFNILTGEPTWNFEGKHAASHMSLSPDERWLIVCRDQQIECWEKVKADGNRISYEMRQEAILGNYFQQPSSIIFASDNQSFYGSLPSGSLVKFQLPDLKILKRIKFPRFKGIRIMQVPQTDFSLMEATVSGSILEAYVADMPAEKAYRVNEHTGSNCKMTPFTSRMMLIATPRELKVVKLPEASELIPLGQALGGMTEEAITVTAQAQQSLQQIQTDCSRYRTEAVGVYEGRLPDGTSRGRGRGRGQVTVNVGPTDRPVRLVLSSYEPVVWRLNVSSRAHIAEIFLSGSSESTMEGLSQFQVTHIGNAYAYQTDGYSRRGRRGAGASRLYETVRQKTGCGIDNFQGSYTGGIFYIGTQSTGSSPEGNRIQKYRDEKGNIIFKNY
jgi:outer membrane murein-binding lipoprotein Lpp